METSDHRKLPLIMIADNDEDERCLLRAVLKLKGFAVVEAADGQEAINVASKELPDLLLIELDIPVVSGPRVIRELGKSLNAHLASLAAVSLSKTTRAHRAIAPEFRAHLNKPVDFDQLDGVIDRLLPTRLQLSAKIRSRRMKHANGPHVSL